MALSAMDRGLTTCHDCGKTQAISEERCERCGGQLHFRKPYSVQRTLAFLTVAACFYFPANFLPVMYTVHLGHSVPNTILGGVVTLFKQGSYVIASIIFLASVFVPIAKMAILAFLCYEVTHRKEPRPRQASILYRLTEMVGRWSMIDVFVVIVLVAMIQLGALMAIEPGPAALAFGGVVVATMLSAMSFDARLIWDTFGNNRNFRAEG